MRHRINHVILAFLLTFSGFAATGCAHNTPPSDSDIVAAIDASGIMKRDDGSMSVIPPVTVVERGQRSKDGSWPVKVKFMIAVRMKDGRTSPPTETTAAFRILWAKKGVGKPAWKAELGS